MHDAQEHISTSIPSFRVIAEMDPPKGMDLNHFLSSASQLKGRVDTIRVTDSEHAIMRMAPIGPCKKLLDQQMEPEMVITGRDRNRISYQADLLAAAALGVTNLVLKTGHDPAEGDQPVARTSGDLDLPIMIKSASMLNQGSDLGGEQLEGKTNFSIGVSLELSDDAGTNRMLADSFDRMAEQGVQSVTLGPTYDLNILETFQPAAERTGIKLYSSIMFLKSVAMVRYINNLPGVPSIPQEFLKKMMNAPVKKDAGLQLGSSLYNEVQELCDGTVILAIGLKERLPEFLDMIGK